jgi:hypothetical protein
MIANEKTKEGLQTRKKRWRKEQIFAMVVACIPLAGFIILSQLPVTGSMSPSLPQKPWMRQRKPN